jgi:hypothetical protein
MKFLEMVFRLSRLVLEIAIGGHDILLVGVVRFLVVIIAAGCDCDPPRAPLLPLLASLSTFLHAFADGSRWRCLATAGDHLPVAQNKGVPIQHPPPCQRCVRWRYQAALGGVRLITTEFMHQGMTHCVRPDC